MARTQADYDKARAQVRRAIVDVTDDQIEILAERRPEFAQLVKEQRERHRRGAEYMERIAAEQCEANYAAEVRRRQFLDARAPGMSMGDLQRADRDRQRRAGVVRLDPRFRR